MVVHTAKQKRRRNGACRSHEWLWATKQEAESFDGSPYFCNEIDGFETSSRRYVPKYGPRYHPDIIV